MDLTKAIWSKYGFWGGWIKNIFIIRDIGIHFSLTLLLQTHRFFIFSASSVVKYVGAKVTDYCECKYQVTVDARICYCIEVLG